MCKSPRDEPYKRESAIAIGQRIESSKGSTLCYVLARREAQPEDLFGFTVAAAAAAADCRAVACYTVTTVRATATETDNPVNRSCGWAGARLCLLPGTSTEP